MKNLIKALFIFAISGASAFGAAGFECNGEDGVRYTGWVGAANSVTGHDTNVIFPGGALVDLYGTVSSGLSGEHNLLIILSQNAEIVGEISATLKDTDDGSQIYDGVIFYTNDPAETISCEISF